MQDEDFTQGIEDDDFDWEFDLHRLSSQHELAWDDLVRILFGLRWSFIGKLLNNDLEEISPVYLPAIVAAPDLLEWILSDCKAEKLKLRVDEQGNPHFQTDEICNWAITKELVPWLAKEKGVPVTIKACKFLIKGSLGYAIRPLKKNNAGNIDWEHYLSIPLWKWPTALQILQEGGLQDLEKFEEVWQSSLEYGEPMGFQPLGDGEKSLYVDPFTFCCWAISKGFRLPSEITSGLLEEEMEKRGFDSREELKSWLEQEREEYKNRKRSERTPGGVPKHASEKQAINEESEEPTSSPQLGPKEQNMEAFVRGLYFCYSEPYVLIRKAGKRPVPFTLKSIGFQKPEGVTAHDFISILNEKNGPYYELGPSHSYLGSGGTNFQDVSLDGTYELEDDDARESNVSTGISEVPQKIPRPEYRTRRERLKQIDKTLRKFTEREYGVNLGEGFHLYEKCDDKGRGVYRFKFQTRKATPLNSDSCSGMGREQILEKLKILSSLETADDDAENDNNVDEYMNVYKQAISKGITEKEIENYIKKPPE